LHTKTAEYLASGWSTQNQKAFYDALKKGEVQNIQPRGARAEEFFQNLGINNIPKNMPVSNNIEFFLNDVATEGYSMFKKTLSF